MSKIKAIKLVQGDFKPEIIEIDSQNFLDECYDIINCRCIDIVTGIYEDFYVDLVVDDEGLLRDDVIVNPIAWYLYSKFKKDAPIVGNAILCDSNEDGEIVSVSQYILDNLGDIAWDATAKWFKLINGLD